MQVLEWVGWWDVPKRCIPVRMGWDPWSPNYSSLVAQCHWIYTSPVIMHCTICTCWLVQNGRDVSKQWHCVSGTIHLGNQGSQNIRTGTQRFGTSRHHTVRMYLDVLWLGRPAIGTFFGRDVWRMEHFVGGAFCGWDVLWCDVMYVGRFVDLTMHIIMYRQLFWTYIFLLTTY